MGVRLGELLVEHGVLTVAQRDQILEAQRTSGRPFGELAERLFGVSQSHVERAWSEQYARIATWIDPRNEKVDPDALAMIDRRQAWQFRVLPLRFEGDELVACTTKENLARALRFAGWRINRMVYFVLAEPQALGEALAQHHPLPGMTPEMVNGGHAAAAA